MQIGVVFPQTEIGADAGAIQEYARAVEAMGYTHVSVYDHVVGANIANRPGWKGPYTHESMFHEPFVLLSCFAAITTTLGLSTGILILPQRQTALVAKQAASLDVLSNGRVRLGVGTGWNEVEYEALGMGFADRGKRYEEQIEVLRELWTRPTVTFKGSAHSMPEVGLNPLPVQRPIPLWMGGGSDLPAFGLPASDKVIRRIARLADGWIPLWQPDDRGRELLAQFQTFCREAGRDPAKVGIEGRLVAHRSSESRWADIASSWAALGASHLVVNTMGDGLSGAEPHLRRLEEVKKGLALPR